MKPRALVPSHDAAIASTCAWIERAVIGLNLCPFAKSVYVKRQIRYVVSDAQTPVALLDNLEVELRTLVQTDPAVVETTLLIHPQALADFLEYNEFLDVAETALKRLGLRGVIQIASFHPQYQFAGTASDDVTNYTNRSPYPMLHLLREASVEQALAAVPEAKDIPQRNIETMRRLGVAGWKALGFATGVPKAE